MLLPQFIEITFCCLYQKDKSSESKAKFRQASNHCKRVLETAKSAYANKTKESITSQKLGPQDFWWIASSVLNSVLIVNLLYPLYSMAQTCCLLHLIKQNCLLKTFQKSRKVRITTWHASRKVNHLSKIVWDRKIIAEFTRAISSTWIGKPVLMMDVKVSKDKNISRWVDRENLIYVRWNRIKNCAQRWRRWLIEEKEVRHWVKFISLSQSQLI